MGIFKKSDKSKKNSNKKVEKSEKIKKKRKIGLGHKTKTPKKITNKEEIRTPENSEKQKTTPNVDIKEEISVLESDKDLQTIVDDEEKDTNKWEKAEKRKSFLRKDMKGKPVFLEDTGEKIGVVFDFIFDSDKNIIGYKIKDDKSDSILSFPLNQFDEDKSGLIFVPSWYTKGIKTIEKLEFKDRISPELMWLVQDKTISNEELYNIFVKHDDHIANYVEESVALREILNNRLKILERERVALKENLMELTEKRLIKDMDRRDFSESVMAHRRKVNVLDVNIKKCKELIKRLENTSFGMMSDNILSNIEQKEMPNIEMVDESSIIKDEEIKQEENLYKQKYYEVKSMYDELQTEYEELKIAVEKLIQKQ